MELQIFYISRPHSLQIKVQISFPELQDLLLLAPVSARTSTELIVGPEVALTKVSVATQVGMPKAQIAPFLSPSLVARSSAARPAGGSSMG